MSVAIGACLIAVAALLLVPFLMEFGKESERWNH
jgi:hypothetical protein